MTEIYAVYLNGILDEVVENGFPNYNDSSDPIREIFSINQKMARELRERLEERRKQRKI